ncbi:MAG: hypothetical protein R3B54_04495 [Bdellovibrionota bacterium]
MRGEGGLAFGLGFADEVIFDFAFVLQEFGVFFGGVEIGKIAEPHSEPGGLLLTELLGGEVRVGKPSFLSDSMRASASCLLG